MKITTIIGPVCSGKTHLLQTAFPAQMKVEIGDVVREIKSQTTRVFDKNLDFQINAKLRLIIKQAIEDEIDLVIVGIRQLSILLATEIFIKAHQLDPTKKIKYARIFLNVDVALRRERFISRAASKDELSFEEIERRDDELGLRELTDYCLNKDKSKTTIKT
jgi:hypothetical protein